MYSPQDGAAVERLKMEVDGAGGRKTVMTSAEDESAAEWRLEMTVRMFAVVTGPA